jgi:hypothetical protein
MTCCKDSSRKEQITKLLEEVQYESEQSRESAIESFSRSNLTILEIGTILGHLRDPNQELERRPIPNSKDKQQLGGVY